MRRLAFFMALIMTFTSVVPAYADTIDVTTNEIVTVEDVQAEVPDVSSDEIIPGEDEEAGEEEIQDVTEDVIIESEDVIEETIEEENTVEDLKNATDDIFTWSGTKITGFAADAEIPVDLVIPDTCTAIGDNAFKGKTTIKTVTLSDNVSSLGAYAFSDNPNLEEVKMSSRLTSIGECCFANDTALTEIEIPKKVSALGGKAFLGCSSLEKVVLKSSVVNVVPYNHPSYSYYYDVFAGCNIKCLEMDPALTRIGNHLFYQAGFSADCVVTIPASVKEIGTYAFGSGNLQNIEFEDTTVLQTIGEGAFRYIKETSIIIPDSVVTLGASAFADNPNLEEVKMSSRLESIGECCFANDTALTEIEIPKKVSALGGKAFLGCSSLEKVVLKSSVVNVVPYNHPSYSYYYDVFAGCNIKCLEMDPALTRIGNHLFYQAGFNPDCVVTIPASVKEIGTSAFAKSNLGTVKFAGANLLTIGNSAFENTLLETVEIPSGTTTIGSAAFNSCSILEKAIVPKSVTSIGKNGFANCPFLKIYAASGSVAEQYAKDNKIPIGVCYSITYVLNGGKNDPENITVYEKGDEFTFAEATRKGYDFAGWYTDSALTKKITNIDGKSANLTVYAKWNAIKYTISYDYAGGSVVSNPATYTIATATITLKNPTRSGYNFMGWYDTTSGNKITTIPKGTIGNINLEAHWKENYYTVNFYANGGTGTMTAQEFLFTDSEALTENAFTRKGYYFAGWNTKSDGKGKSYDDMEVVSKLSTTNKGVVKLYAMWSPVEYAIDYNLDGGTNAKKNPVCFTIKTADIKLSNPTKTGFTFEGWYGDEEFTGSKITKIAKGTAKDIVLFAKWKENTYKVAYSLNGGKLLEDCSVPSAAFHKYTEDFDLPGEIAEKNYYTLTGWNTSANGKGTHYDLEETVAEVNATNGKVVTLYAEWTADTFEIEYVLNGGTNNAENPEYRTHVADITLKNPTKAGYTFKGWYEDEECTKKITKITKLKKDSEGELIDNITVYAKWQANTYKVVFAKNGGSGLMSKQTMTYDSTKILSKNKFTRKGYDFVGWNTKANGTGESYSDEEEVMNLKKSGSITLYAQWEKK